MKYIPLADTNKKVSQIGLGTWQFGSKGWGYGKDFNKDAALKIVQKAFELGVNLIDTAEVYGKGDSERIVGEAIQGIDREEIIITTKFLPITIRPSSVFRAVNKSLKRLQTPYIDIYLIHWPNPILPLGQTLKNMEKLVDNGLIRHIGVSNFSLSRFKKAQKKIFNHRIEVNQVNYSMVRNKIESEFLPFSQEENILVMAYSPLAQGWLTGKYSLNTPVPSGIRRRNRLFWKRNMELGLPLLSTLKEIADKYEVPMAQIALNWIIRNPNVIAIPGAKSEKQVEINTNSSEVNLAGRDVAQIKQALMEFKPKLFF